MATQAVLIDATTNDVTSDGSLASGTTYRLEAQGGEIRLHEAASAPASVTAREAAYIALDDGDVYWHEQGTENLYAWTPSGSARLVINAGA